MEGGSERKRTGVGDASEDAALGDQTETEEGLNWDGVDRELVSCAIKRTLGRELEGLVKRCNLEGGERPGFSCLCLKNRVERVPFATAGNRGVGET